MMAGNLTTQVRSIAEVTKAVANGDLVKKIECQMSVAKSLTSKILSITWWTSFECLPAEVTRVAREVGTEGKLGGQAVSGCGWHMERFDRQCQHDGWQSHDQVRSIAQVTTAVANGDLSKKSKSMRTVKF